MNVDPTNPVNQNHIKLFELEHRSHTLITIEVTEIKEIYEEVEVSMNVAIV